MPDWLVGVLVQFPMVVVMGLVFGYANRRLERELARTEAGHARSEAAVRRSHEEHLVSRDRELSRLRDDLRDEVRAVGRKVDALARKLS